MAGTGGGGGGGGGGMTARGGGFQMLNGLGGDRVVEKAVIGRAAGRLGVRLTCERLGLLGGRLTRTSDVRLRTRGVLRLAEGEAERARLDAARCLFAARPP